MQKYFLRNLFWSQYLFELYHTSLNIKNSKNMVKRECLKKVCCGESKFTFEMNEGYRVSCLKVCI